MAKSRPVFFLYGQPKEYLSSAPFLQLISGMKYVNPDSPHALDMHSEDRPFAHRASDIGTNPQSLDRKTLAVLMLGAGAIAYLASMVARRRVISSLRVGDLKVDSLEVDRLKIKTHEHATSSMEESGGVLRFELGSSDVFENGLE